MPYSTNDIVELQHMPRGGPTAGWLDRVLQTDRLEYLDRDDVPEEVKQAVISAIRRFGERVGIHERFARFSVDLVRDVAEPKILELGAGHGELSAQILALHPGAQVTVTDINPTLVMNIASGPVGQNPRATTQVMDATDIDSADGSYDLVVFAGSFHHLPPATACRAIVEATRVGKQFVVIDGMRPPAAVLLMLLGLALPVIGVVAALSSKRRPALHDTLISSLRMYSKSAFTALGRAADPALSANFRPIHRFMPIGLGAVVYRKPGR